MAVDLSEHVEHPPAMHVNVGPVTLISTFTDQIHLLHFRVTVIESALESSDLTLLNMDS